MIVAPDYVMKQPLVQGSVEDFSFLQTLSVADRHILFEETSDPVYLHWDKIKYKPLSLDLPPLEMWTSVKMIRSSKAILSPIRSVKGEPFTWVSLSKLERLFHEMDMNKEGDLFPFRRSDEKGKIKLKARGIIEEAIASSQLEGASTTRKVAKKLLAEGRKPRSHSEQMIANTFQAMKNIEEDYRHQKLSQELLFEMHAVIVKHTVRKSEQYRLRKDEENIVVSDKVGHTVYYYPPSVSFVEQELQRLIAFANDEDGGSFIHPILKAMMLHFWVGYLHPFTDGNGRLARSLFYWYLLRKGYWLFAYLPLSSMIKKSPGQYSKAYLYTEQDDLDLTYFIDYNIRKIEESVNEFETYLETLNVNDVNKRHSFLEHDDLNERQVELVQYLHEHPEEYTSPMIHQKYHQISKSTALRDLKDLLERELLLQERRGKRSFYFIREKEILF